MIQISADILRTYAASDWPDGMSTAFGCVSSGGDLPFCSRVCVHVARGSFLYFSLSLFFSLFSSSLFSLHRYDWSKTHDDDGTELGGTCGTIAGPWLVTIELAMHEVSIRDLWRVAVFFYLFDLLWSLIVLTRVCVNYILLLHTPLAGGVQQPLRRLLLVVPAPNVVVGESLRSRSCKIAPIVGTISSSYFWTDTFFFSIVYFFGFKHHCTW